MMKKIAVFIFAVLYLGMSTGATVHIHYCMGKLIGWGLLHSEKKDGKCSGCGMVKSEKNSGCCKDKSKLIKIGNDQKAAETACHIQLLSIVATALFIESPVTPVLSVSKENPVSHSPPRTGQVAIYIRNCLFLI